MDSNETIRPLTEVPVEQTSETLELSCQKSKQTEQQQSASKRQVQGN